MLAENKSKIVNIFTRNNLKNICKCELDFKWVRILITGDGYHFNQFIMSIISSDILNN